MYVLLAIVLLLDTFRSESCSGAALHNSEWNFRDPSIQSRDYVRRAAK